MEEKKEYQTYEEQEIDLYEIWLVLVKYKKLILGLTFGFAFFVAFISLFMTNIYRSKAVILPVEGEKIGEYSGLAQIIGLSLPPSGSSAEIIALLKSDILKAEMIKRYNLLPILFHERWDEEKKQWKKGSKSIFSFITGAPGKLVSLFQKNKSSKNSENNNIPTIDDGIRMLKDLIKVNEDRKLGTIAIAVDYPDPQIAAKLVQYTIDTLRTHMSEEAIRIANKNKKLLEKELIKTSDPIIQQKLYALIAQQVETITMARVNENFAFKVIDPPRVPDRKYKPKRTLMVMVAFVTALFFSIFLAFFIEYIKNIREKRQNQQKVKE